MLSLPGFAIRGQAQPGQKSCQGSCLGYQHSQQALLCPGLETQQKLHPSNRRGAGKKRQCCLVFASYPAPCCSPEWLRSPSENGGVKKAPQGGQEAEQLQVLELCSLVLS